MEQTTSRVLPARSRSARAARTGCVRFLFSSCSVLLRAGRHAGAMASPVSCVHPVACGESIGAGLYPASCFFPLIYREIQGKRHVLRRRCSSLAMLAQRRSGDCAQVERDDRQSSGLECGVHLPDAVPLRQMTRQRKQQKRCRLAPSRNARRSLWFPADRIRTRHPIGRVCFRPGADIVLLVAAVTLCAIDRTTRQAWTCRFSKDNHWG
jgi:hypothetical protein